MCPDAISSPDPCDPVVNHMFLVTSLGTHNSRGMNERLFLIMHNLFIHLHNSITAYNHTHHMHFGP